MMMVMTMMVTMVITMMMTVITVPMMMTVTMPVTMTVVMMADEVPNVVFSKNGSQMAITRFGFVCIPSVNMVAKIGARMAVSLIFILMIMITVVI